MIHQYKLGGYNIVLDVASGAVHAVDEVAYDIIAMYEENDCEAVVARLSEKYRDRADVTADDIRECYDEIAALADAGKIEEYSNTQALEALFEQIEKV